MEGHNEGQHKGSQGVWTLVASAPWSHVESMAGPWGL